MDIALDCRGLACPGPVLRCKECVEKQSPNTLTITVDNQPARENVTRFLTMRGYSVTASAQADGISVLQAAMPGQLDPPAAPPPATAPNLDVSTPNAAARTAAFITADTVGRGDPELGEKLMLNFLGTLPELGDRLWRIILVNGGVKLSTIGHPALAKLQALAASGVSILVCGTCLDFFGILDQKAVGETTNMLDVVTSLDMADKVIQI